MANHLVALLPLLVGCLLLQVSSFPQIDDDQWLDPEEYFSDTSLRKPRETRNLEVNSTSRSPISFHVTAIYVDKSEFPLSSLFFRLTLRLAINEAQARLSNKKVSLTLSVRRASTCSQQFAGALAAEEYFRRHSSLFVVSGCDDAIRSVSQLASQWSVPIMTAAGFGADLNDKLVHSSLIRVAFSLRTAVEFLVKILRLFNWQRVNLIVDESDTNSVGLKNSISDHIQNISSGSPTVDGQFRPIVNMISLDLTESIVGFKDHNLSIASKQWLDCHFNSSAHPDDRWPTRMASCAIEDAIRQSSLFSRVSILLMPQLYLRRFMLSVYDLGLANGHYTFINMPILPYQGSADEESTSDLRHKPPNDTRLAQPSHSEPTPLADDGNAFVWRSLQSSSKRNSDARRAFESLMSIYLRAPTTKAYVYFANRLAKLAESELATRKSHTTTSGRPAQLKVNPYAASYYDCIQIYASLLLESLGALEQSALPASRRQLKPMVLANISRLARNRRYDNQLTGNIILNQLGDREADYTLDDMDPLTGTFAPAIIYKGHLRELERSSRIHWSSNDQVGQTVDNVDCQLNGSCPRKPLPKFLVTLLLLAGPLVLVLGSSLYLVYRRISLESKLVDYWWRINFSDIELVGTRRKLAGDSQSGVTSALESAAGSSQLQSKPSGTLASRADSSGRQLTRQASFGSNLSQQREKDRWISDTLGARTTITRVTQSSAGGSSRKDVCYGEIVLGIYKLSKVAIKPIAKFHQSRKLMIELRTIKEISHTNLCRFVGIIIEEPNVAIISEFCPKGSLREFFKNESMIMDWTFKCSIINDILSGLVYLHASPLEFHGRLKSSNCLVSSRFVVKLTDFGLGSLREYLDEQEADDEFIIRKLLCRAPEHLRSRQKYGSKKGDVYSFGLLLYEVLTNNLPFYDKEKGDYVMPLKSLYQELKSNGPNEKTGPDVGSLQPENKDEKAMFELMSQCWQADVTKRPSSLVLATALRRITRGVTSKKLLENLTCRMEQYTNNLESLVEAKLATLVEEKQKTEELLYQFVPQSIAQRLKDGDSIEPEAFSCVTVLFSDIVGFTSLSSESTPIEVIDFLSDLYLCFDETLEQYDIFKVDTIGDAYIVASGLPEPNEGKHVVEIARAALELRQRLASFEVAHKPKHKLQMRVGIHSGPCIAGIVGGSKMPKYCVFGDTLSIGKFMESSGLPMKIHVTSESQRLLSDIDGFRLDIRVPSITRDGIPMKTFWLETNARLDR